MDRGCINELLGMTKREQDALADSYERDTWDSSSMGEVIEGQPLGEEEMGSIVVELA